MTERRVIPILTPFGRDAVSWLRQGGPPELAGRLHWCMVLWYSFWFERHLALQRRLHAARQLEADPLFILGLWRSGTTFFHSLLGACPGMVCPTTWQCMNPASFRLQTSPARGRPVKRPMDAVMIDNLSPQEDEFALLALGVPSVYRGFVDPRRLPELACWLDPAAWSDTQPEGWMGIWLEFLAGVANGQNGRLLLKSPNHTFRIRALMKKFPGSIYIWLVRDPKETFFSNRKMWSSMFHRYALWQHDASELDAFLLAAIGFAAQCLEYSTIALARDRLVVVDLRGLVNAPVDCMDAINVRLHLGSRVAMTSAVAAALADNPGYRADAYDEEDVPSGAAAMLQQLADTQQKALFSHGI